jgi:flagellar protein FliO/FliZ
MGRTSVLGPMEWMSFGLSFILVLLTIGALYFLFHRFVLGAMPMKIERRMKVVETLAVGPRQKIVLMRVAGREVVIGITAQQMNTLVEWPLEVDAPVAKVVMEPLPEVRAATKTKSLRELFGAVGFGTKSDQAGRS